MDEQPDSRPRELSTLSAMEQLFSTRLKTIALSIWRRAGAVPVAVKVIGLIVLPLLLVGAGGALFVRQRLLGVLAAHGDQSFQTQILFILVRDTAIVLGAGAGVGVALAIFFTTVLTHPLRALVQAMRRVQSGDLTVHVPVWASDEIGEAQAEFNDMVTRLRNAREALLKQQRELEDLNQTNMRLLSELHSKSARLQQLFGHTLSAQEAERKRLSRELHDETGQALTSILLRLKVLQDEADPNIIADRLNGLRYLTSQTLENVRRLSMDLRPTALDDLGLVPAIRWYTQECARRSGIEIEFNPADGPERLPTPIEIVLYRAVQEGLTNVIRHARAQRAHITLERSPHAVWLTIVDDGQGIEPGQKAEGGLGLEGMRERVSLAGGRLQIDSAPGAGTRIVIELPLGGEPS